MKTTLSFCLLLCLIAGCKSQEEEDKVKLEKAIRQIIENNAFKNNKKVDLLVCNLIKYDRLNKSQVDTIRRLYYRAALDHHKEISGIYYDLVTTQSNMVKASRELNDEVISNNYKLKMRESIEKGNLHFDSANYFFTKDSTLALAMSKVQPTLKDYFRAKFFVKSTIGGINVLDTLYWVMNKDFQKVDLTK